MHEIGKKLQLLRSLNNYTQAYIAETVGMATSTYINIEQGHSSIAHHKLEAVLAIYNIDLSSFFSFTLDDIRGVTSGEKPARSRDDANRMIARLEALNKLQYELLSKVLEKL
ncbi:helix-turn-helix domain-containing protein [Chitinophaga lutea]